MHEKLERFILKHRRHCEMPDESGVPICISKAVQIVELESPLGYCYTIAVCNDCARYVRQHNSNLTWKKKIPSALSP
jgi:hypothetical protein